MAESTAGQFRSAIEAYAASRQSASAGLVVEQSMQGDRLPDVLSEAGREAGRLRAKMIETSIILDGAVSSRCSVPLEVDL